MPLVFGKPIRFGVLNMALKCAICEIRIYQPNRWFCYPCYKEYEQAIRGKEEWTRFLVREESKRRYRVRDEIKSGVIYIHLGDKWDIDTRGKLILRREGFYHGR